jgi:cytochrome c peroxidase
MDPLSSELLALGLVLIVAFIFILLNLVGEIGTAVQRKWLIFCSLGAGVMAFSFKIAMIIIFSSFPRTLLSMVPESIPLSRIKAQSVETMQRVVLDIKKSPYQWRALPLQAPSPPDNPATEEKIRLGKKLFFDKRLSRDDSLSCASCHEQSLEKGGSDGKPQATGIDGQVGSRNVPTVFNAAFQRVFFWDGRAGSLEEQAKGPILNPIEMGMPSHQDVEIKLRTIDEYQRLFRQVFNEDDAINIDNIAKAIAAYERTLITPDTAYDRFVRGDKDALTEQQLRGMALFESSGCIYCHSGPNFSEASIFSENSVYRIFPSIANTEFETKYNLVQDQGVATGSTETDRGIWRVPTLRNVAISGPYLHNGSVDELEEVVRIMSRVQLDMQLSKGVQKPKTIFWSSADKSLSVTDGNVLTDKEVSDITAFLQSLSADELG